MRVCDTTEDVPSTRGQNARVLCTEKKCVRQVSVCTCRGIRWLEVWPEQHSRNQQ